MKVVILAGGKGTRLGSVSGLLPKPMIEVAGKPMIWHIMKIYSHYGFNDFVICLGYKGHVIKDYFFNIKMRNGDFSIDTSTGEVIYENTSSESWNVTLAETGLETLKGGRIKKIDRYLDSKINMLTYGDGVSDINIQNLLKFHESHGKTVTITGVRPPSLFGEIIEKEGKVISFEEKPQTQKGLINGGFVVFNREMMDYLSTEQSCDFEFGPLEKLAREGEVMTYIHDGFWECADTVRDIENLNKLWKSGNASWKLWD